MTRPTIADVARAANVSKATVSRVLSGNYEYMKEETRQRVLETIERLNYRPNKIARSLSSKRTNTIALMISDVGNPFYSEVIHGVEDISLENNYNIFLCNTNYNLDRGKAFVDSFIDRQVDGVIIMSSSMNNTWLDDLAQQNIPTVVLDWEASKTQKPNTSILRVDFETGIFQAVDHLFNLGHRHFAHFSGPLDLRTAQVRRDITLKAIKNHGLGEENLLTIEGNLQIDGGRQALRTLLEQKSFPTAIISANDLTAFGILTEARTQGIHVPERLSVIGIDDIWLAQETNPPLTTIALPRYEIGQLATQTLFKLIESEQTVQTEPLKTIIETSLVIRETTAAASKK